MNKQVQLDNLQTIVRMPIPQRQIIIKTVRAALNTAKNSIAPCQVQISLVGPRKMRTLNKKTRGIDSETDVLSFPYFEWENAVPGDRSTLSERVMMQPENGYVLLGDIVISTRRAVEQAEEYNHSVLREICFLAVHGTLHLLGYDHMTPEDDKRMNDLTQEILSSCGVLRDSAL